MNRKSSFRFGCIIWLFAIHIGAILSQNTTTTISNTENPYSTKLGIQHVLSRKKRYLLFPTGSSFVATMSFAKAMATTSPLGINLVVEVDFYYPLYSSISELFPKKKKPSPKSAQKPEVPILTPVIANPKFDAISGTYFDNDSYQNSMWRRKDSQPYSQYSTKFHRENYIPINSNNLKLQSSKPSYEFWKKPSSYYVSKPSSYSVSKPSSYYVSKPKIYSSFIPKSSSKYSDWNWKQRESYRSRRDLYKQVEGMAEKYGFEITTCIHRMICEGRHYLLPPGVSFFQDVLRILFTVPSTIETEEGYSKASRASKDECTLYYNEKCPYSIIGYLIHMQQEQNK